MNALRSRFPVVYSALTQFKEGSVQLYRDGKLRFKLKPRKGQVYTPHELITYHEFRNDVTRCLPIFVLFWIPFIGAWIALPLGIAFPRQLLSRQFWTPSQRVKALDYNLVKRCKAYTPLTESLIQALDVSKIDQRVKQICCDCLEQLSSGRQLEQDELTVFRRFFNEEKSMHPSRLHDTHKIDLAASLGVPSDHLIQQAIYINNVDRSLSHFGIHEQSKMVIDMASHQRGVKLNELSIEEAKNFLNLWLSSTSQTTGKDLTYLLHLPLLMRNNHRIN